MAVSDSVPGSLAGGETIDADREGKADAPSAGDGVEPSVVGAKSVSHGRPSVADVAARIMKSYKGDEGAGGEAGAKKVVKAKTAKAMKAMKTMKTKKTMKAKVEPKAASAVKIKVGVKVKPKDVAKHGDYPSYTHAASCLQYLARTGQRGEGHSARFAYVCKGAMGAAESKAKKFCRDACDARGLESKARIK